MTPFELEILNALRIAGDDVSVAELISRSKIARARANVSSRLCELRTKDLCASRQHDGVNYWSLTAKGREALGIETGNDPEAPNYPPDIADPETTPEPVTDQSVEVDISADISAQLVYDFDGHERTPRDYLHAEAAMLKTTPRKFERVDDALFVLTTLSEHPLLDGMGHFQNELTRIADYLEAA